MIEPLWIFLHVPKCGGTTFKAHVENHLAMEETFFEFSHWGRHYREERGLPEFVDRPDEERARARVLAGHLLGYGIHHEVPGNREARYFTVLRDPAERCVSLYNYRWSRGQAPDDFGEWYEGWYRANQSDFQTTFLARRLFAGNLPEDGEQRLAMAQRLLGLCWFVTTTDRWSADLGWLFGEMGLPGDWRHYRKAGESLPLPQSHPAQSERLARRIELDDTLRAMIEADSARDVRLLEWVRAERHRWPEACAGAGGAPRGGG